MKTRSTEEIIRHALQKELSVLSRAKDKARQTSEDYINAHTELSETMKEFQAELDKKAPCPNKLVEINKRTKYFDGLTRKNPDAIFDKEHTTRQEHDALASYLTFQYKAQS